MKCKSCKFWNYSGFGSGECTGLSAEYKIVSQPPVMNKKGSPQKRAKMVQVRSGVTGLTANVVTPENFFCKNWNQK